MSQLEKIRVLRIINRFNLGGPTYNAAYLTKYLGEPFETKLIGGVKDDSEASSEYMLENIGVEAELITEMKRSIGFSDITAYRKIAEVIHEFKPHIVHTHASKAGTLGRLAAINNNVPIIIHTFHGHVFHSYFGKLKTLFYTTIERWLAKRSTRIIAISEQQKHEIGIEHKICPPDKIEVVRLGFDLSRFQLNQVSKRLDFRSKYNLSESDLAIVIVGRLAPVKNHKMFLDAAKTVIDHGHDNVRFFIVGDGESKAGLIDHCKQINLGFSHIEPPSSDQPVCFTSWIKEVDWVYAGCDIVCLTSLNEGTPVSLIEALSAGKPVISTKVGGIQDIVEENKSGILVNSEDVAAFSNGVECLIEDSVLRKKLSAFGTTNTVKNYSYQRLCDDIEQLYLKLIQEKL